MPKKDKIALILCAAGLLAFIVLFVLKFRGIVPDWAPQAVLFAMLVACYIGLLYMGLRGRLPRKRIHVIAGSTLGLGAVIIGLCLILLRDKDWIYAVQVGFCGMAVAALVMLLVNGRKELSEDTDKKT